MPDGMDRQYSEVGRKPGGTDVSNTQAAYDVFISYSHRDYDWVHTWLVPRLRDAGLSVCIDDEAFDIGISTLVNIENAMKASRHILLVLTPAWVASQWTNFESILSQTKDLIGLQQRTLPLLREMCEVPSRIAILTYANLTGTRDDAVELRKIVRAIQQSRAKPTQPEGLAEQATEMRTDIAPPAPVPNERVQQRAKLRERIEQKRRRLHHRELQKATFGASIDPAILMEIEDLEREIVNLEQQLAAI